MITNKPIVFIHLENIFEYDDIIDDLKRLENKNENDLEELTEIYYSYFENDPDLLKFKNEDQVFIDLSTETTCYICTIEELTKIKQKILTEFYTSNEKFEDVKNTWKQYNELDNVIAYRGGKGYLYSIWGFNPKNF